MKNETNLVELTDKEMKNVNGGSILLIIFLLAFAFGVGVAIEQHYNQ